MALRAQYDAAMGIAVAPHDPSLDVLLGHGRRVALVQAGSRRPDLLVARAGAGDLLRRQAGEHRQDESVGKAARGESPNVST
jgi:hypothetical protein